MMNFAYVGSFRTYAMGNSRQRVHLTPVDIADIGVARGALDAPAPPQGGEKILKRNLREKFVSAE